MKTSKHSAGRAIRTLTAFLFAALQAALVLNAQPVPAEAPPASPPPRGCVCAPGNWYDANRRSCVTGACTVKGMPDGDKGGGYFAWHGNLFVNTPCVPPPCGDLDITASTGQPGWMLVSSPGVTISKAPVKVTSPSSAWAGPLPGSNWVSIDANGGNKPGDYVYEFTFCLCQSFKDPVLSLSFLADNSAIVKLNNGPTLYTTIHGNTNFKLPVNSFSYSGTGGWQVGTNKVQIIVHNGELITGLDAVLKITSRGGACPTK